MTEVFSIPVVSNLKEDGTTDHVRIMSKGPNEVHDIRGNIVAHKAVFNRILVITNDLDDVLELRSRLPEVFQQFDPVRLVDLMENGWRPEPERLVYAHWTTYKVFEHDLGNYLFHAYSVFEKRNGEWIDHRDGSNTKWGRVCEGWHENPNTIKSTDVLNGIRKLENQ